MTGGTENSASTKMVKALGVNSADVDEGDDGDAGASASEVGAKNTAKSEGTKKSLEAMFNAMAPLKSNKNKKGKESDSEGEGEGRKRRRTTATRQTGEGEPANAEEEALVLPLLVEDYINFGAHMYPRAPIVSENICRPKLKRQK